MHTPPSSAPLAFLRHAKLGAVHKVLAAECVDAAAARAPRADTCTSLASTHPSVLSWLNVFNIGTGIPGPTTNSNDRYNSEPEPASASPLALSGGADDGNRTPWIIAFSVVGGVLVLVGVAIAHIYLKKARAAKAAKGAKGGAISAVEITKAADDGKAASRV